MDTLKNKVNKDSVLSLKNITINIETVNTKKAHTSNDTGSDTGTGNGSEYWSKRQQIYFSILAIGSDYTNRHQCFPISSDSSRPVIITKLTKEVKSSSSSGGGSSMHDVDSSSMMMRTCEVLECDVQPIKVELNVEAIGGLLHFVKDLTCILASTNKACLLYKRNYGHVKANTKATTTTTTTTTTTKQSIPSDSKKSIHIESIEVALIGKDSSTSTGYCNLLSVSNIRQLVDIDSNTTTTIESITLSTYNDKLNDKRRACVTVSDISIITPNNKIAKNMTTTIPNIHDNMDSHGWRKFIDTTHDSVVPSATRVTSVAISFHPIDTYNLGLLVGTLTTSLSPPVLYAREPSIANNVSSINPTNFKFKRSLTVVRDLSIDMHWDINSGSDYYLPTDTVSNGVVQIKTGGVLVDSASYGSLVSKMSLSLGRDVVIETCKDGKTTRVLTLESNSETNYSFDDNNIFVKDSYSLTPLFSTLKHPHNLFWYSDNDDDDDTSCIVVSSSHTNLSADKFQLKLDSGVLHNLNRFISMFKTGQTRSKQFVESSLKGYITVSQHDQKELITLTAYEPFKPLSKPISIFFIDFKTLDLCLSDNNVPVGRLGGKQLQVYMISFGPMMKQTVGNIRAFYLIDDALAHSLHRNIIWSSTNDEVNSIDFHMSNVKGSPGLLELKVDRLRVIYLNRIVNTLTCFFRDYCIPSIKKSLAPNIPVPNLLLYPTPVKAPVPMKGMFRVCVRIRKLEAHLPMGCSGTDAFTVICKDAHFIKICPETDFKYCLGPLMAKGIDLFEFENAKWSFAATATHRSASHHSNSNLDLFESNINPLATKTSIQLDKVLWKLPQHAYTELRSPENGRFGASKGSFDIQLNHTTIASWCNQNVVGDNMNLHLVIALTRIVQAYDGMYGETLNQQGFAIKTKGNRNFILVDIEIEDICWVLAQGQYLNICRMLQTNFQEVNRVVPDPFIIPKPKRVHLTEKLFGNYCMDKRLPIASSVPLRIRKGQITIAENTSDYYDLVSRLLNATPSSNINELGTPSDIDSIPSWSWHHYHRNRVFNGVEDGNRPRAGEYIMTLHVRGLVVEFYRRHFGGGNGIEVSAETLIMTSCDTPEDDDDYVGDDDDRYSQFSIDDISADNIILAPKSLAQLNQKTRLGDRGSFVDFDDDDSDSDDTASTFQGQHNPNVSTNEAFTEPNKFRVPNLRYRQQGVGNLRRCVVEINDSLLVLNMPKLQKIGSYFGEPVQLGFQRHLARIKAKGVENPDFKASMDLEVHAKNTIFCLTNKNKREGTSAFCLNADLDYTNAVRGFLRVGPGKVTTQINLAVKHVFITPLHEIKETGCQSLVDPFTLSLDMGLIVSLDEKKMNDNLSLLYNYLEFSSMKTKNHKADTPVGIRRINAKLVPGNNIDEKINENQLNIRLSLKDIVFIKTAIQQLTQSLAGRTPRPTIAERYGAQFASFEDYNHLPTLNETLVHVNDSAQWQLVEREIVADICKIEILMRNNIYNSNIAKLNLTDLRFSYHKNFELLHMAAGLTASAWSYNDPYDAWEPIIESASMSAVAATDATFTSASLDSSRVRVDAYCNPIEINASQSTITTLIRKIAMADVITTTSIHLPPYRIVNELGVPVKSIIKIGDIEIISSMIEVGTHLPIEMNALTEASKIRKRRNSQKIDITKKEYTLGISFELDNSVFSSKDGIPLDREGTYPFQLKESFKNTQKSKKNDSSPSKLSETSSKRSATTSFSNMPHTVVSVRVKEDGGRELVLRSLLSLSNSTSRTFYVLVTLGAEKAETYLNPGMEWYIPINVAHPRASLYFRVDHRSEWVQVLSSFAVLIQHGSWGAPSRLQAELCACPPENPTQDSIETSWVLLLRPEVREMKDGPGSRTLVNVKYPTESNYKGNNAAVSDNMEGLTTVDDIYNNMNFSSSINPLTNLGQPMCVQLLAPLQLCNLLCQPLLYRLADKDGVITSEGILLPGHIVDIHSVFQLFSKQIYLSLRMINFQWSKWTKVLSRRIPYAPSEKVIDVTLNSMDLIHEGNSLNLPPINISMAIREHFVRLSCPILIANRTGFELDFCEPSTQELYFPLDSRSPAESLMPTTTMAQNPSIQSLKSSTNKVSTQQSENEDLIGLGFDEESLSSHSSHDSDDDDKNKGSTRGNIMSLIVHLPMDHMRKIEVFVSIEWTLQDVLMQINKHFPNVPVQQLQSSYVFFPWEAGKNGPKKVDHSPAVEVDLFTKRTISTDDKETIDTNDEINYEDQTVSGKSRFDSISSRFTTSSKQQQSRQTYFSSSLFSSSNPESIPPTVQFNMIADCQLEPLPLTTKVNIILSLLI